MSTTLADITTIVVNPRKEQAGEQYPDLAKRFIGMSLEDITAWFLEFKSSKNRNAKRRRRIAAQLVGNDLSPMEYVVINVIAELHDRRLRGPGSAAARRRRRAINESSGREYGERVKRESLELLRLGFVSEAMLTRALGVHEVAEPGDQRAAINQLIGRGLVRETMFGFRLTSFGHAVTTWAGRTPTAAQ